MTELVMPHQMEKHHSIVFAGILSLVDAQPVPEPGEVCPDAMGNKHEMSDEGFFRVAHFRQTS